MQDIDRIAEANAAIDRRAAQRNAAALAQQEANTPEALAAEKERQAKYGVDGQLISQDEHVLVDDAVNGDLAEAVAALARENINDRAQSLQKKLEEAAQEALEEGRMPLQDVIGLGRCVFQWMLVPSDEEENEGGLALALQLQVDEQPPAGFVAEITVDQLVAWAKGKGLQGNRIEHKRFVAALFERIIPLGASETANQLIYTLEQLMLGGEALTEDLVDEVEDKNRWDGPKEDV